MLDVTDLTNLLNGAAAAPKRRGGSRRFWGSIGASQVGNACDALIALSLRGFPGDDPAPKLARIFRLGHSIEDQVIADLKTLGLEVLHRNDLTNKQFTFTGFGGHAVAKADAIIIWPGQVGEFVEIKSMNDAKWKSFAKDGVAKSHPEYVDQCQMLMGLSGLRSTVLVGYNKNTSEYHIERLAFDAERWSFLTARIDRAMEGDVHRISEDPDDFRCRGCFKREACRSIWVPAWGPAECSHCEHAYPDNGRQWWCRLHERYADKPCLDFNHWRVPD